MFSEPFPKYFLLLFESHLPTEYPPQGEARLQPQTHRGFVFWGQTSVTLAMSSPQASPEPQQPENPESIPAQERSLSPEWIHAITNLMSHPITSEIKNGYSTKVFLITPTL